MRYVFSLFYLAIGIAVCSYCLLNSLAHTYKSNQDARLLAAFRGHHEAFVRTIGHTPDPAYTCRAR